MEKQQSIKGKTILTDPLYTRIESANWLLAQDIIIVGILLKRTQGILSEFFDTKDRDELSATCQFEKDKKDICLMSYTVKTKSKDKKNVAVFSTCRLLQRKTIDDGKKKPQIIKYYYFTKGRTDIVDHLNDCYTTRTKSCRWVMVALFYMLGTFSVNGKTFGA